MTIYKCDYCGNEWEPDTSYYFSKEDDKCPKCGEVRNIRKLKYDSERSNPFGYNLDFLKPKKKVEDSQD